MSKREIILFVILFALTATFIGYPLYPHEKESILLDFEDDWIIGSYEIGYQGQAPLLEFSYNGFNYTTNPASPQEDSLFKNPIEWSFEKIKLVNSTEHYQNFFVLHNSVYVLYAILVNGEVYYSVSEVYTERESYNVVSNILDRDTIEVSFHPDWVNFWLPLIAGSLMISTLCTFFITVHYKQKKQKRQ